MNIINLSSQAFCYPWGGGWQCSSPPAGFGGGTGDLSSLGGIISTLVPYIFAISGIILLFMIVASGYTLLTSTGNPEGLEKGKKRLTASLVGFILVFAAFWIWQIIQLVIGYNF